MRLPFQRLLAVAWISFPCIFAGLITRLTLQIFTHGNIQEAVSVQLLDMLDKLALFGINACWGRLHSGIFLESFVSSAVWTKVGWFLFLHLLGYFVVSNN